MIKYTIPISGLRSGMQFGMANDISSDWVVRGDGNFLLDPTGDHVFLYCINHANEPMFIFGVSFGGHNWLNVQNSDSTLDAEVGLLPERLIDRGSIQLPGYSNWRYVGLDGLTAEQLKTEISNLSKWEGSGMPEDTDETTSDETERDDNGGSDIAEEDSNSTDVISGNTTGELARIFCSDMKPADIVPLTLNSQELGEVVLMALVHVSSSVGSIYLTSSPWNGTSLVDIEGYVEVRFDNWGFLLYPILAFTLIHNLRVVVPQSSPKVRNSRRWYRSWSTHRCIECRDIERT